MTTLGFHGMFTIERRLQHAFKGGWKEVVQGLEQIRNRDIYLQCHGDGERKLTTRQGFDIRQIWRGNLSG